MLNNQFILYAVSLGFLILSSCSQQHDFHEAAIESNETAQPKLAKYVEQEPHPYGGWFCPDNFGGFPPIDIHDYSKISIVKDRLPTKEETENGTSLIFIDTEQEPDAKALDLSLPRMARIYSKHNEMEELIIVIQAIVVNDDTVLGFRYPSGGNGSAWLNQVRFLTDREEKSLKTSPFVYHTTEISATKSEIWRAMRNTVFTNQLAERFDKKEFFDSEWTNESQEHFNLQNDEFKAAGIITTHWGNMYLHIDYQYNDGSQFTEKLLVMEDAEKGNAEFHFVSGPYSEDFKAQNSIWAEWVTKVKLQSEM